VKLVDDGGSDTEHFSISGIGHISLIIQQDGIKERRDHAFIDHGQIISLLDVNIHELQDLFFDGAQTSNFGSLGLDVACVL
jgi:hypothetical protein